MPAVYTSVNAITRTYATSNGRHLRANPVSTGNAAPPAPGRMQRRNRRHQVDAGLPLVDQRARGMQVQLPAPSDYPLDQLLAPSWVSASRRASAVGNTTGRAEHASRPERTAGDIGRVHPRCGPRRCGG